MEETALLSTAHECTSTSTAHFARRLFTPPSAPEPNVVVVAPPAPPSPSWVQSKEYLLEAAVAEEQARVQARSEALNPPTPATPVDPVALAAAGPPDGSSGSSGIDIVTSNPLSISTPQLTAGAAFGGALGAGALG